MKKIIGVFAGSLRKGAFSKSIADYVTSISPEGYEFKEIEFDDLPMYNPDLDDAEEKPTQWVEFREKVKGLDGFLFITPEYNRSVPGVLKNALDVGSRPYGESVWDGKPAGVISVSPGAYGGFGANHHLRQVMVFLNVLMLQQPEAYLGDIMSVLNEDGVVTDEKTKKFLNDYVDALVKWVDLIVK
ncbi:MAG: NAD(P)H-dependent oxidoreductase [Clostridiales bacterium]|nr:NAD(P)H-dependent oxidoreductase [Clostridiales bacterium]